MKDYFALIRQRESCRSFSTRPVEKEKLALCLEAARLAPSARNAQPWRYLAVTNPELLDKLRPMVQGMGMNRFADDCPALVVVVETPTALNAVAKRFKLMDFAPIDIGLSASQFCYAAEEQGLSTCILGWLDEKRIRALFHLKPGERARLVLCVGYAAGGARREKKRKPIEQVVTYFE